MNYRHAYHAGNVADVFKHYVLCEILAALKAKPTPFCVVDSHAGAGLYPLKAPGEFEHGIGTLWPERDRWPALARYFGIVASFNDERLHHYPGSPLFIRAALRAGLDRAVLLELHPEEHRALKAQFAHDRQVAVHHTDAWDGVRGFVPPRENRGLLFVDPPFERRDEFARIDALLRHSLKHWRNGVYAVWYPIKSYRPVERFLEGVASLGANTLAIEFLALPLDNEQRLNGSGLILINPPWQLADTLRVTLPALAARLAGPNGRPDVRIRMLGDL